MPGRYSTNSSMMRRFNRRGCRVVLVWMVLIVLTVATIKPLRNTLLYPVWPSQWRPLGSYRIINMHVRDLFFPMDRAPYAGSCDDVTQRIQRLGILQQLEVLNQTFHVYTQQAWDKAEAQMRTRHDDVIMKKLHYFRPALTEAEQRTLLGNLFVLTSVLEAFNVSYVGAEGTLIGALRHGGLIPWDDDGDVTFKAEHWPVAKRVLSCVPGYELKIHSDFMWKFFSSESPHWTGEAVTRFPYVDLFPYVEDEDYMWPLVIWLKDKMLWPRRQVFPTRHVPFDNFWVRAPRDIRGVLTHLFGDVSMCESRLFERRERKLMPMDERVRVDCSFLHDAYPFLNMEDVGDDSVKKV
ncbi:uncharacterized protein [Littorina saxatilis]|uniref:uncharacterized protein n=1 Tax=Littorina saxatilis TaxID=31220 RepID=UPI0038B64405